MFKVWRYHSVCFPTSTSTAHSPSPTTLGKKCWPYVVLLKCYFFSHHYPCHPESSIWFHTQMSFLFFSISLVNTHCWSVLFAETIWGPGHFHFYTFQEPPPTAQQDPGRLGKVSALTHSWIVILPLIQIWHLPLHSTLMMISSWKTQVNLLAPLGAGPPLFFST